MAADAASLRIDTLSISPGLTASIEDSIPSTRTRGLFPAPLKVFCPLINKDALFSAGFPEDCLTEIPLIFPCSSNDDCVTLLFSRSLLVTLATDPVRLTFLLVPYPMATTSSNPILSSFMVTLMFVWLPTKIS